MMDVHKWIGPRLVNGKRCGGNASVFVSAGMRCVGNNVVVTEMKMLPSIGDELWTWCFRSMNVEAMRIVIIPVFVLYSSRNPIKLNVFGFRKPLWLRICL